MAILDRENKGGLMSVGTQTLDTLSDILGIQEEGIAADIQQGQIDADEFERATITGGLLGLEEKAKAYLGEAETQEKNFNAMVRKYGPDKIEELNSLALGNPEIYALPIDQVEKQVEKFLTAKTAPDILPTGEIRVRTDEGAAFRTLGPEEGGETYREAFLTEDAPFRGMTGAGIFTRNMDEINANLIKNYGDLYGSNVGNVFLGEFTPTGGRTERRVMGRQFEEERANTISQEEFTQNVTEIVNRKLVTTPSLVTQGEIIRATSWYPTSDFDSIRTAYMQEFKNRPDADVQAMNATMAFAADTYDSMIARGQDPKMLIESGVIPSNSIVSVILNDPAADLSRRRFNELSQGVDPDITAVAMNYRNAQEALQANPDDKVALEAQTTYYDMREQLYNDAKLEIANTGFYDTKNQFLSLFQPEQFPPQLIFDFDNRDVIVYPIAFDGQVKLLDAKNPNINEPISTVGVEQFVKEEFGGSLDNLYYNEAAGFNSVTNTNKRMDFIFNILKANDPYLKDVGFYLDQIVKQRAQKKD